MMSEQRVIDGSGEADARGANAANKTGEPGSPVIKEGHLPRQRPPLSKDVLLSGRGLQDCSC